MRKLSVLSALALVCMIGTAQAQDTGTQPDAGASIPHPADCTFTKAVICKDDLKCEATSALGDLPLPSRVLIHFEKRMIAATGPNGLPHISSIHTLAHAGDSLILQGVNGAVGWTIQSSMSNGQTIFVTASTHSVLTVSGTCKSAE